VSAVPENTGMILSLVEKFCARIIRGVASMIFLDFFWKFNHILDKLWSLEAMVITAQDKRVDLQMFVISIYFKFWVKRIQQET